MLELYFFFPFRCVCVDTLWKGRNVLSMVAAGCFFPLILLRVVFFYCLAESLSGVVG